MKSFLSTTGIFLLLSVACIAQTPKYSNEFLSIGVGARALGMSNAYISSVNDVTSGYWNPAGLTGLSSNIEIALMHSEYFAGIAKYDYGAIAARIDSLSAFGVSFIRFGVDDIPNTTQLIDANGNVDYNRITSFSAADYGFLFSYARKMKIEGLRMGANAKVIRRIVGDFGNAWGFGLDAAMQYDRNNWKFALMARDITTTFNAWSFNLSEEMKNVFSITGNSIPENSLEITLPKFILGGARKFNFFNSRISILTELDFDLTVDGKRNVLIKSNPLSADPHFGIEAGYLGIIFLRGGIGNIQKSTDVTGKTITTFQPNVGVGVKIKAFTIDYALSDIGDQSTALYSNVFSLKLNIYKTAP